MAGTANFNVKDARFNRLPGSNRTYIFWDANLGWTDGQQVSVSLTGPGSPGSQSPRSPDIPSPDAPSAPTNLRAAASGQNVVNLSWTAPDENYNPTSPDTAYELQWSENSGSTWKHLVNPGGTSYTQFCVTPSKDFRYRVRAYSREGEGDWSNIATPTNITSSTPEIVSPGWIHIPRNPDNHNDPLGPGESFRLLFVTSSKPGAGYTNIASYNSIARGEVEETALGSFKSVSCALISTESVSARDNTATTGAGVPIYWVKGEKVADSYSDFYDGSWDSDSPTNENGTVVSNPQVWTGSQSDGYRDNNNWAGASEVTYGLPGTGNQELNSGQASSGDAKHLYALSPVIKVDGERPTRAAGGGGVPRDDSATPEQPSGGETPTQQPSGGSEAQPQPGGTSPSQSSPTEPGDTAPQQCEETGFDCTQARGLKERECDALVALYDATCGAGWNWTGLDPQKTKWFATPFAAGWQGITIEEMSVRELRLSGRNLRGELPQELADLEGLEVLDLSGNQGLNGDLPREQPEELLRVDVRGTGISRPEWADRIDDFRPGPRITTRIIETSGGGCAVASGKDEGAGSALLGLLLVASVLLAVRLGRARMS